MNNFESLTGMPSNQKFLITLDCDGTLLTEKKTISPATRNYLKYLEEKGNIVAIASGRPSRAILPYYNELDLKGPFIAYNGALTIDPKDSSFKPLEIKVKNEVVRDFLNHFGEDTFFNLMAEDEEDLYYLRDEDIFDDFFHPRDINKHVGSLLKGMKKDVFTLIVQCHDQSRHKAMSDYIATQYEDLGIRYWYDAPLFGEFYHYSVNKATSMEYLEHYYHIDKAHTISFGDAPNDLEMIRKAGISFAMKNGSDLLKKESTFITPADNDHDGIYLALRKLFEGK
ncbi:MAG: Cof-type HAD-IIB family hydrolase [Bacilli bacterium]|jgi:Cof subfamily protein (haloacid dehalogenase superfamily)